MDTKSTHLIVLGAGSGYLVNEIVSRSTVPVFHYDPFDYRFAPHLKPSGHTDIDAILARVPPGKVHIYLHPGCYSEITRFEQHVLLRHYGMMKPDQWVLNRRHAQNMAFFLRAMQVYDLGQPFQGRRVHVVGGADSAREFMKTITDSSAVVMAIGQAMRFFRGHVRRPDVCLLADFMPYGLHPEDTAGHWFVNTNVDTVDLLPLRDKIDRVFMYHMASPFLLDLWFRKCGFVVFDEPYSTSVEIGVHLAYLLGSRDIRVFGADYCQNEPDIRYPTRIEVQLSNGDIVWTNPHYYAGPLYLNWFQKHHPDLHLSRCGGGLHVPILAPWNGDGVLSHVHDELCVRRTVQDQEIARRESVARQIWASKKPFRMDYLGEDYPQSVRSEATALSLQDAERIYTDSKIDMWS